MGTEMQARKSPQVRAGIYGRESEGSDQSIQGQLTAGRRAAGSLGWTVVAEYQDEVSASERGRKPRVDWPRLIADIEAGKINAVIVRDATRADRDLEYWARFLKQCRRLGVLIYSVIDDEIYDVRKSRPMLALANEGARAQAESDKTSERVKEGHQHAYAMGRPSGGDCPYGYKRDRDADPSDPRKIIVTQVDNPKTAEVVRWIFKSIADGTPLRSVLKDLNRRRILSPRGVEGWQHGRVRGIITNPVYIGMRRHNGQPWVKGSWPALVDEETYHAANRILDQNKKDREGDRPGAVEHLLSGVIKCACSNKEHEHPGPDGVCGGDVSGRGPRAGRSAKYGCREYGCASVGLEPADECIVDAMFDKFADPKYVPELLRRAAASNADAAALGAEVERLQARKREWEERFASEEDADLEDSILVKIRSINGQIAAAQRKLSEVSVPPALRVLFGETYEWDADALTLTLPDEDSLPAFIEWARPGSKPLSPEAIERYSAIVRDPEYLRGFDLVRRWGGLSIPARRGVIRDLMEIKLYPSGRGRKLPVEERLTYRFR